MATKSQQPNRQDVALSSLNAAAEALNLAKGLSSVTQAKTAFASVTTLLVMIRVRFLLIDHPPANVVCRTQ